MLPAGQRLGALFTAHSCVNASGHHFPASLLLEAGGLGKAL